LPAPRETLHRGRLGDPERVRDLAHRQLLAVVQHEHVAIRLGHARERFGDHAIALGLRRGVERIVVRHRVLELDLAAAAPSRLAREVARDPAQPRTQAIRLAQLIELTPRRDERLLGDVLAERLIARSAVRHRGDDPLVALDERPERRGLTALTRGEQLGIGHRHRSSHVARMCSDGPTT
jgi:hypothetical protein